jgi:hypothetical protein
MIGHGGSWQAFTTTYNRYPELELSIVVFCNSYEVSAYDTSAAIGRLAVDAVTGE